VPLPLVAAATLIRSHYRVTTRLSHQERLAKKVM
jgi:hypothetical protein